MAEGWFGVESDEIEKIDFLLDALARAVERGELHHISYDLLASRYLGRRADLVAKVMGVPRQPPMTPAPSGMAAPPVQPAARVQTAPTSTPQAPRTVAPVAPSRPAAWQAGAARPQAPLRVQKPVDWPTVLLFLGAFLVVVASAIFSVAVWGNLGTLEKFAFLGLLTVAFYGTGWWALKRLKLAVGAIALTAVASGMLLFDGWILIDGYKMEGPLPWAVLFLVCSAVYFGTEMLLAGRVFGVVGAAAQVAWWWLLGDGLGLPGPTRFAGIALVVLAWQLAAERGRGRRAVDTLASVLEWAAPIVALGCVLGLVGNLLAFGPATPAVVGAAAVTSGATAWVMWRSRLLPRGFGAPFAAALQFPVFVAGWSAAFGVGHEWWVAGVFAAAAALYYAVAFRPGRVVFAGLGLLAEVSAVFEVCRVLDLSGTTTVVVLAALAAMWALGARLVERWSPGWLEATHAQQFALVVEFGAFALLVVSSCALPVTTLTLPVPGFTLERAEALGYLGVLAAWWASCVARPRGVTAFAGSLWAFVTLWAIQAWALPDDTASALIIAPFIALAGVWLLTGFRLEERYGALWGESTRWAARGTALAFSVLGLALAVDPGIYTASSEGVRALWALAVLATVAIACFGADAGLTRFYPSAVVAALLAATAIPLLVRSLGFVADWREPHSAAALAAGATAVLVAAVGAWLATRARLRGLAPWVAATGAAVGTAIVAVDTLGTSLAVSLAWVMLAGAWALVASVTSQEVVFAAGMSLVAAAWQALGDSPAAWTMLLVIGSAGVALGAVSFVRPFGVRGRFEKAGSALAVAGVLAHVLLAGSLPPDAHQTAVALLLLAVNVAVGSALRRFEPGYYAAGIPLVIAAWIEVGNLADPVAVLYSTPLALYLVAASYLFARVGEKRENPLVLDVFAVLVGIGYPVISALQAWGDRALVEAMAAVVVSLVAIGAGVLLKVRWYFFGGVVGLAVVALYRSYWAIAEYWWLVLGLVGVAMLVVALTWQRQRMLVADARDKFMRSFEGWR